MININPFSQLFEPIYYDGEFILTRPFITHHEGARVETVFEKDYNYFDIMCITETIKIED